MSFSRIAPVAALLLAFLSGGAAQAEVEKKVEGRVLQVRVTLCQYKPRGCAGYFVLDAMREGRREQLTVQVRLGVPIRNGEDYVLLATLPGRVVSVTHVVENGAIVARSIEVLERPPTNERRGGSGVRDQRPRARLVARGRRAMPRPTRSTHYLSACTLSFAINSAACRTGTPMLEPPNSGKIAAFTAITSPESASTGPPLPPCVVSAS